MWYVDWWIEEYDRFLITIYLFWDFFFKTWYDYFKCMEYTKTCSLVESTLLWAISFYRWKRLYLDTCSSKLWPHFCGCLLWRLLQPLVLLGAIVIAIFHLKLTASLVTRNDDFTAKDIHISPSRNSLWRQILPLAKWLTSCRKWNALQSTGDVLLQLIRPSNLLT